MDTNHNLFLRNIGLDKLSRQFKFNRQFCLDNFLTDQEDPYIGGSDDEKDAAALPEQETGGVPI